MMEEPTEQSATAPGPEGVSQDVPCPECGYNLRGLTVPRCPECGYEFDWATLSELIEQAGQRRSGRATWTDALSALVIVFGFVVLMVSDVGLLVFGFMLVFVVGVAQTAVELGPASLVLGGPTWKRCFAWWEGALIGLGVCAVTILAAGYGTYLFDRRWVPGEKMRFLPLLLLLMAESYVVQCFIFRWRMALFGERISVLRLLLGCLLARTITASVLLSQPFRFVGRF